MLTALVYLRYARCYLGKHRDLEREVGAGCRNRTDDLRITSALLYQLS